MAQTFDQLIAELETLETESGLVGITVVAVSNDGQQYINTIAEAFVLPMLIGLQAMAMQRAVAAANALPSEDADPDCAPSHDPACPAPHLN